MEDAAGFARAAPVPEVIVISDDDESDSGEEAPSTDALQPFSWSDVTDMLLSLAKCRELREDQQVIERLLHDLGIPLCTAVRHFLYVTCEKLGELLVLLRGNDRRYRACEDLVMVVCEVLSLAQTAPCRPWARHEPWIKEEGFIVCENHVAMNKLYELMNRWQTDIVVRARSGDSGSYAISATMSRLEMLGANCTQEIESLQNAMIKYGTERQSAADEFADIRDKCRDEAKKRHLEAVELEFVILEDTYNKTGEVRSKFEVSSSARKSLEHRAREMELRFTFYRAALSLACSVTQLEGDHGQAEVQLITPGSINVFGSNMLIELDNFFAALQDVMVRSSEYRGNYAGSTSARRETDLTWTSERDRRPDLLSFAKHLEEFWLIHRNWLPSAVLNMAINGFYALYESNGQADCPISNAVSRLCSRLREGLLK